MSEMLLSDERIDGWWDVARAGKWRGSADVRRSLIEVTEDDLKRMARTITAASGSARKLSSTAMTGRPWAGWPPCGSPAACSRPGCTGSAAGLRQWLREGAYRSR